MENKLKLGDKYHSLTVISEIDRQTRKVTCVCDCGNRTEVGIYKIVDGHTKSCGKCVNRFKYTKKTDRAFAAYKTVDGLEVKTREYRLWWNMKNRCGDNTGKDPTYSSCTISNNFKDFQFFAEWCNRQIGFESVDCFGNFFQIDKDVLVKGNKEYNEETCVFIPKAINVFLTLRGNCRGDYPIGVYFKKDAMKYRSQCNDGYGRQIFLGDFATPEDAFMAYKRCKESVAKNLAITYKGAVDDRVVDALLNFTVSIDD